MRWRMSRSVHVCLLFNTMIRHSFVSTEFCDGILAGRVASGSNFRHGSGTGTGKHHRVRVRVGYLKYSTRTPSGGSRISERGARTRRRRRRGPRAVGAGIEAPKAPRSSAVSARGSRRRGRRGGGVWGVGRGCPPGRGLLCPLPRIFFLIFHLKNSEFQCIMGSILSQFSCPFYSKNSVFGFQNLQMKALPARREQTASSTCFK